ncbi:MAG: hypothetical protein IKO53_04895 [Lachnospiraceae bacterium]|nr:hypothetical protein [Lachnospiraceae bacterium]
MKQSTNLWIAAICLLMLAIFIESSTFPDLAKFLRLFTAAAGIITLCFAGRAERLEEQEEKAAARRAQRPDARLEHNYSPDFNELYEYINRISIIKKVDAIIETLKKEQPPCK